MWHHLVSQAIIEIVTSRMKQYQAAMMKDDVFDQILGRRFKKLQDENIELRARAAQLQGKLDDKDAEQGMLGEGGKVPENVDTETSQVMKQIVQELVQDGDTNQTVSKLTKALSIMSGRLVIIWQL